MKCLLCGKDSEIQDKNWTGYRLPETYEIYNCKHCNTSFSYPQVKDSDIYDNLYLHSNELPGYKRYAQYTEIIKNYASPLQFLSLKEETYWAIKKVLEKNVCDKKNTKIIEVGCGLGYLTYSLYQDKYNVLGIDISGKAVIKANERFGKLFRKMDIFDISRSDNEKYDITILTEVIEHVHNPIEFLGQIKKHLNENGKIIVTTPNKSVSSKKCVWDTDLPPVHQWWFSEKSMEYIAKELDLGISFVNFSDFYRNIFIPIKTKAETCKRQNIFPILDIDGSPIKREISIRHVSFFRRIISRIFIFKYMYDVVLKYTNWFTYLKTYQGRFICVIFEKNG